MTARAQSQARDQVVTLVVAIDAESGIGKNGQIPWRVPDDIRHFKRLTSATATPGARNAVIMGRATWDSIPPKFRPLRGRLNVVLSRRERAALNLPGEVVLAGDLHSAVERAREASVERVFIIGGGQVYAQALDRPDCREIYLTTLDRTFACDTHLPALPGDFALAEELARGRSGEVGYRIERWQRQPTGEPAGETDDSGA